MIEYSLCYKGMQDGHHVLEFTIIKQPHKIPGYFISSEHIYVYIYQVPEIRSGDGVFLMGGRTKNKTVNFYKNISDLLGDVVMVNRVLLEWSESNFMWNKEW